MKSFHVRVPAKWVLSGEHSVLRGAQAIALPHPSFSLTLDFSPGGDGLSIFPDEASHILNRVLSRIEGAGEMRGKIRLESDIPIGAGLGSSAALCVALTRWVQSWSPETVRDPLEFARSLEDSFHGKSSGMDVAVILANEPVAFRMGEVGRPLRIRKIPKFTFHDTGVRAMTRDCIEKVQAFRAADPRRGGELDQTMSSASLMALEALQAFDSGHEVLALPALASAVSRAHGCFEAWGLVPVQASEIIQDLMSKGALACKLTGAGGGGMVVALWGPASL
jgi:mevalonate kinase